MAARILSSNSVEIRDFVVEDADALADIEFDPEVKRYVGGPPRDRRKWLERFRANPGVLDAAAIVALPEGVLAGRARLRRSIDAPRIFELQVIVGRTFWGRRLGRSATGLLLQHAFGSMGARAVTAVVHPENIASLALVRDFGFEYLGPLPASLQRKDSGHIVFQLARPGA